MFWLLMKTRLVTARNVALYQWRRQPVLTLALTIAGMALFGGMCIGFLLFFKFAAGLGVLPETAFQAFYYLFLLLLAGAVPFVASTLLQSEDYHLLFIAPVTARTVVAAKLLEATVTNSLQFSVLGLPAIVAIAIALGLSPWLWLIVPILIALFLLLPALLTALGLLLALAAVGMARLRTAITSINVVMGLIVCLNFVVETRNLPVRFGAGIHLTTLRPALDATSPTAHVSPSHWFAESLIDLAKHDYRAAASAILCVLILDALLFGAAMLLGGRLLSVASLSEGEGNTSMPHRDDAKPAAWRALFSPTLAGIIAKDWKLVWRDSMLISQLSVPLILFAVPFLVGFRDTTMNARTEIYPFTVGIIGFIVYMQTSILSLSLLGMEAQGFWVLLASPAHRRSTLVSKWLLSTLVCGGVGVVLGLFAGAVLRAGPAAMAFQAIVTVTAAAALCGLGVGISALFPRFIHENPAMRVSPWALIVGFFAASGYVLTSCVIFGIGAYLLSLQMPTVPIVSTCILLFVTLTTISTGLPLYLGGKRLERFEWDH
jgi:ABC-2 type transport system permease protein